MVGRGGEQLRHLGSPADARRAGARDFDLVHPLERRHTADRLFRKRPPVGQGAQQPPVEVDRRSAHSGDDPGLGEPGIVETHEDDLAPGRAGTDGPEDRERDLDPLSPIHLGDAHTGPARSRIGEPDRVDGGRRDRQSRQHTHQHEVLQASSSNGHPTPNLSRIRYVFRDTRVQFDP